MQVSLVGTGEVYGHILVFRLLPNQYALYGELAVRRLLHLESEHSWLFGLLCIAGVDTNTLLEKLRSVVGRTIDRAYAVALGLIGHNRRTLDTLAPFYL